MDTPNRPPTAFPPEPGARAGVAIAGKACPGAPARVRLADWLLTVPSSFSGAGRPPYRTRKAPPPVPILPFVHANAPQPGQLRADNHPAPRPAAAPPDTAPTPKPPRPTAWSVRFR